MGGGRQRGGERARQVMHFVGLSDLCVGVCYYFCLYFHMSAVSVWLLPVASLSLCLMSFLPLSCYLDEDPLQPVTSDETVSVGGTVTLTCRVAESDNSSLQWSNTAQQTLYFGEKRGEREGQVQRDMGSLDKKSYESVNDATSSPTKYTQTQVACGRMSESIWSKSQAKSFFFGNWSQVTGCVKPSA